MTDDSPLDARMTVRVPRSLLEQASQRCRAEGLSLSVVVRTALQDYVRYGMELSIRRGPPEEEKIESIF
jgi:antitoxin component of RelBE/YafQ-DinJ toxin-antitoxin module